MDPPGSSPNSTCRARGIIVHHKKLVKQPSDPLTKDSNESKRLGVKDLYSSRSTQDLTGEKDELNQRNSKWISSTAVINSEAPSLRRFSQCGVASGSDEYQSVLKDFLPKSEEKVKESKRQGSRNKSRKISFNEFGTASRFAKRLEDISLSPRSKRSIDMLNAPTISSINRAVDHRKSENNGKPTQSRRSFPFSGIKEAWRETGSSVQSSDRRRHVSLPAPPTVFYSEDRQPVETLVEPFRSERTARKKSSNSSTIRSGRKISTVVSPHLKMNVSSTNALESHEQVHPGNPKKESSNLSPSIASDSESSTTKATPPQFFAEMKKKQITSAANGHEVHPNLLLGINIKQAGNNEELPPSLEKQFSAEDSAGEQHVAMKAHKNFRRIGKAALAARRFLRINNNESSGSQKPAREISPLVKEERLFDEMVEEMKTSYQELRLDNDSGLGKLEKRESPDYNQS